MQAYFEPLRSVARDSKSLFTKREIFSAARRPGLLGATTQNSIDNCQHVLLRCCVNLLDFYQRLGVGNKRSGSIASSTLLSLADARHVLKRRILPAPAHFLGSFLQLKFLSHPGQNRHRPRDACDSRDERRTRTDLDPITMLDWLPRGSRQTDAAIERYWRQVLVSAINEERDP